MSKITTSFFFLLLVNIGFTQEMDKLILSQIYSDTSLIRSQKILSLHVYSESTEENYDNSGNYLVVKKRSEIEYNALGLPVYERNSYINERSYALGDNGTKHVRYTYDDKRRIASTCNKGEWHESCQYFTYNNANKLTSIKNDGSSVTNGLLTFKWENGVMIEAVNSNVEETDYFFERTFDSSGRVSEMRQGNGHLSTYEYVDNGLETRMISSNYLSDSLTSRQILSQKNDTDQFTYFCKLNGDLDTLSESIAVYNEVNDLISLKHTDHSDRLRSISGRMDPPPIQVDGASKSERTIEPSRVIVYTINNEYESGLLIKRVISIVNNNGYRESHSSITERFIYENMPLGHRSWPSNEGDEYDY
jgi:hypothetical protein